MKIKFTVLLFLCLYFFVKPIVASAQSLPKLQQTSLLIPTNVKIDGKALEWNNKFQAYNNSTQLYYTIANNNEQLYLILQATDPLIIRKIIATSITFSISKTDLKQNRERAAITYPVFDKNDWPNINLRNRPIVTRDSLVSSKQVDSFMYVINHQLLQKAKTLKVSGLKMFDDTVVSVYNAVGIKAFSVFDHKLAYTYELSVPLKYLGLSVNVDAGFNYNIKLNGSDFIEGVRVEDITGGTRMVSDGAKLLSTNDMNTMRFPTDFSGKYVLIKKP